MATARFLLLVVGVLLGLTAAEGRHLRAMTIEQKGSNSDMEISEGQLHQAPSSLKQHERSTHRAAAGDTTTSALADRASRSSSKSASEIFLSEYEDKDGANASAVSPSPSASDASESHVERLLERCARNNAVAIFSCNQEHAHLCRVAAANLDDRGVGRLAVAADQRTCDELKVDADGDKCCVVAEEAAAAGHEMHATRWEYVELSLSLGVDVILQDCDVMWRVNPVDTFRASTDVGVVVLRERGTNHPFHAGMGWYRADSPAVFRLVRDVNERIDHARAAETNLTKLRVVGVDVDAKKCGAPDALAAFADDRAVLNDAIESSAIDADVYTRARVECDPDGRDVGFACVEEFAETGCVTLEKKSSFERGKPEPPGCRGGADAEDGFASKIFDGVARRRSLLYADAATTRRAKTGDGKACVAADDVLSSWQWSGNHSGELGRWNPKTASDATLGYHFVNCCATIAEKLRTMELVRKGQKYPHPETREASSEPSSAPAKAPSPYERDAKAPPPPFASSKSADAPSRKDTTSTGGLFDEKEKEAIDAAAHFHGENESKDEKPVDKYGDTSAGADEAQDEKFDEKYGDTNEKLDEKYGDDKYSVDGTDTKYDAAKYDDAKYDDKENSGTLERADASSRGPSDAPDAPRYPGVAQRAR